jgi:4-hydroxy-tetrahydrodipicolinate reductase
MALCRSSGKIGWLTIKGANELGHEIVFKINRSVAGYDFISTKPDTYIDFSAPADTTKLCTIAAELKIPVLVGTTGLTDEDLHKTKKFAKSIPILISLNFSMGIHVLRKLIHEAVKRLPNDFDTEIMGKHEAHKIDISSGTALSILGDKKSIRKDGIELFGRQEKSEYQSGNIGVHAVRGGYVVGEHDVYFSGQGEHLEITHRVTNRDIFARGALFVAQKFSKINIPKLYNLEEIL